jgi:predicted component of type VI protein secretion system
MNKTTRYAVVLGFLCTTFLISCSKFKDDKNKNKGPKIEFFALVNTNTLAKYDASKPERPLASVALSGMQSAETMLAIDFRPATGQLYGIGSSSRIYVINPETGVARAIADAPFTPALAGTVAAFDFNPTVDRIRLISSGGQNLRLNPETGAVVFIDGTLNIGGTVNGNVSGAAYTENKAGATTTVLFDIDVANDILYKQDPPNAGGLVAVGNLGVDLSGTGEMDIDASSNTALAVYNKSNKPSVFTIDLNTGAAVNVGELGEASSVRGIAIPSNPVAYAVADGTSLLIFNPEMPVPVTKPIMGTQAGETIVGIDFRPANGQLYALGSSSRLYTINTANGMATAVGTQFANLLVGTQFGFDFNPTVDRIRIVSNTGLNLRAHPVTGVIAFVDGSITGDAAISSVAYTNNFAGATTTVLFDIDPIAKKMYKQDPPNNGTLVEVGTLGINTTAAQGFDIGGSSNQAWAILTADGKTRIYKINLTNGSASPSPANYEFATGAITAFAIGLGF